MEMENFIILMEKFMKGNLKMIKKMEKENTFGKMGKFFKEHG